MRTTINIDDTLLAKAPKLAGSLDRSAVVHAAGRRLQSARGMRPELVIRNATVIDGSGAPRYA